MAGVRGTSCAHQNDIGEQGLGYSISVAEHGRDTVKIRCRSVNTGAIQFTKLFANSNTREQERHHDGAPKCIQK